MKKIIISGNIGRDAECREGSGGHKFVTFSVAYDKREGQDSAGNPIEETFWADCEIYVKPEKSADKLVALLSKGRHIALEAGEKLETWIDREGGARGKIVYRVQTFDI